MNYEDTMPTFGNEAHKTTEPCRCDCSVLKRITYNMEEETMKKIYRKINEILNGGEIYG